MCVRVVSDDDNGFVITNYCITRHILSFLLIQAECGVRLICLSFESRIRVCEIGVAPNIFSLFYHCMWSPLPKYPRAYAHSIHRCRLISIKKTSILYYAHISIRPRIMLSVVGCCFFFRSFFITHQNFRIRLK